MSKDKVIYLTLLNGTGYVFNAEDYMWLRQKHRIVGAIAGRRCSTSSSPHKLNLPVELTPWELRLVLEKGLALLVSKKESLLREPTSDERRAYDEAMSKCIATQKLHLKEKKILEVKQNIISILAGRRKKLCEMGVDVADNHQLKSAVILEEITSKSTQEDDELLLTIPTAHARAHDAKIMPLPTPVSMSASFKYQVFREIWSHGKFLTCGQTFGADFLVYPSDPMLYHASHMLILLHTPVIRITELIAKVRLSVNVNKVCTFAFTTSTNTNTTSTISTDDATTTLDVCYQRIRWWKRKKRKEKLNADSPEDVVSVP